MKPIPILLGIPKSLIDSSSPGLLASYVIMVPDTKVIHAKSPNIIALQNLQSVTAIVEEDDLILLCQYSNEHGNGKKYLSDPIEFERNPALKEVNLCMLEPGRVVPKLNSDWCKALEKVILKGCRRAAQQKDLKEEKAKQMAEAKVTRVAQSMKRWGRMNHGRSRRSLSVIEHHLSLRLTSTRD